MKKYLVELLGKEKRILLTENEIKKGICFEGYSTMYLIKDTVKNVNEYVRILEKDNEKDEYVEDNLSSILDYNEVEFTFLQEFITDEDIKEYIKEGYKSIYISGENNVEDIKELYSYSQEEYYVKFENGKDECYQIDYKEEVEYIETIKYDVYGETLLYKNIDLENRYVYLSHYQNTEIEELSDFEIEELLERKNN